MAEECKRNFLARLEYPTLWETQEMQDHSMDLCNRDVSVCIAAEIDDPTSTSQGLICEDRDNTKVRAIVAQCVALVGEEAAFIFEGLACARVEKPTKRREGDAHAQEGYQKIAIGGGQEDR